MKSVVVKLLVFGLVGTGLAYGSFYGYRANQLSKLDAEFQRKYADAKAAGLVVTEEELKAAASVPIDQDAAPIYRAAFKEIAAANKRINWRKTPANELTTEARKLIKLIGGVRQKPRCDLGYDFTSNLNPIDPLENPLAHMRSACRILAVASIYFVNEGDEATAIESLDLALTVSAHVGDSPNLISALVRNALDSICFSAAAEMAMNPKASPQLRARLAILVAEHPSLDIAKLWYFDAHSLWNGLADDSVWRPPFGETDTQGEKKERRDEETLGRQFRLYSLEYAIGLSKFAREKNVNMLDFANRFERWSIELHARLPIQLRKEFSDTFFSPETALQMMEGEARRSVALAYIDVAQRKAQTGAYPTMLGVEFTDPYIGKPLRYELFQGQPVIWSVGFDKVDGRAQGYGDTYLQRLMPKGWRQPPKSEPDVNVGNDI